MNTLFSLSLATIASALTHDSTLPQAPLLNGACSSNAILSGECPSSILETIHLNQNSSQSHNNTQTLEEAFVAAQSNPDFPWSYWPTCYSNENTTEPVCVFGSQNFADGRGVFLVTTPSKAYGILNKPAFTDKDALSRVNNYANPPYEVREMPGKGRGLIANKTLHRGDQIFASTPLAVTDADSYVLSNTERLHLLSRGVDTLPPSSRDLFWGLLDHFSDTSASPEDGKISTNAFDVHVNGDPFMAVMPEIAMTNHDCRPNAAYFWDEDTLSHYVHATQTILPGEEISITYINNERIREERFEHLKRNWGFECSCSACSAHPEFVEESDARIQQADAIIEKLNDWTSGSQASPELAETLISLYTQERLDASFGMPYKHAAEVYSSFGDRWNAVKYARLSIEFNVLDKGFEDRDVAQMKSMADSPEMSWSWKKRVGMGAGGKGGCGCGHAH